MNEEFYIWFTASGQYINEVERGDEPKEKFWARKGWEACKLTILPARMPSMDEVYRFMRSNPLTSSEMLNQVQTTTPREGVANWMDPGDAKW